MSGTDGPGPAAPQPAADVTEPDSPAPAADAPLAPDALQHDPTRRAFFRELGRQALTTVGQVAGLADAVGRGTTSAAASLLGVDLREPTQAPPRPVQRAKPPLAGVARSGGLGARSGAEDTYKSPYRMDGDLLHMLDQRRIPEALEELTCRRGSDVAYYLRTGACRGGPLMAQVAAYGLALTARERQDQPHSARVVESRRTRNALLSARPSSRLLGWAMARMAAVEGRFDEVSDGHEVAAALRAEADAIASRFQLDHAVIAAHLARTLVGPEGRPLSLIIHGDPGALWGGLVGPAIAALTRLVEEGRELRIFVTETRPFLEGSRLASWELRQAGIAHEVIVDAAVAWLLEREPVDAVLVGAEWIAANGDVAAVVGSRGLALLAAEMPPRQDGSAPRVVVCASSATIDLDVADGTAIPTELRPLRELAAFQLGLPPTTGTALNPATDVIPAAAVSAIVTERGTIAPVTAQAVVEAARATEAPDSPRATEATDVS